MYVGNDPILICGSEYWLRGCWRLASRHVLDMPCLNFRAAMRRYEITVKRGGPPAPPHHPSEKAKQEKGGGRGKRKRQKKKTRKLMLSMLSSNLQVDIINLTDLLILSDR